MQSFLHTLRTISGVFLDALTFIKLCFKLRTTVAAENLFLRKQLGLFIERKAKPHRATDAIRFTLARLSRLFDWRNALTIVKPDTLIHWHRKGFRLFWKHKSRPRGRPRIPVQLRKLIADMASNNPTWGEERIADELLLKIGIRISPRTVRRYMPKLPRRAADPRQRWMTFVRNHAKVIVACDFFVVMTATFQFLSGYLAVASRPKGSCGVLWHCTKCPSEYWKLYGDDEGSRRERKGRWHKQTRIEDRCQTARTFSRPRGTSGHTLKPRVVIEMRWSFMPCGSARGVPQCRSSL